MSDLLSVDKKKRNLISTTHHRRFPNVTAYVKELGGSQSHVIEKVLIANNGVAAVKAIRSIRRWAYDVFGDERAIQFVVMATPEDLRANAEYIRMGDTIVDVPGGSNNHNYANVTLIVELARLHGVHAVWAGWGHASENPLLPDTLAKSEPPIKFIGPMGSAMRALGDKIGSTIIAQTAGVPCIAWNGDQIFANYNRNTGYLPEDAYKQASVASATDAYDCAVKIGFPVMIKASEGGGGKGIRRVERADDVAAAYRQVCGEVPGSPIFIMKLVSNSRHLEVQVLADEYGNAIALYGRDCSVQRRHQKIIEEGPPIAALPEVWTEMEKAAVTLAQAVGYSNAGTVEYLYSEVNNKFFFLELNPRLQVEHPVTEMITRVNLPAAQLQIAMGIQLYNIPDIRELYGKNRFEEDVLDSERIIDFEKVSRVPPYGHCIAVRITAENAEAGFKPTSGGIQELNFRSTPNVWGYFSMDSSGSIHEYADSQFGHLFASGIDREQARRNMVLALKELSIRGDISTTVDYISKLIERDDFINNEIDTSWLDEIIQQSHDDSLLSQSLGKSNSLSTPKALNRHLKVVIGATALAYDRCINDEKQFLEALGKGHLPSMSWLSMVRDIELILDGFKYKLRCTRTNTNRFHVSIIPSTGKYIESNIRYLSDGGYLIEVGGKTHVAYLSSKGDAASGMRLTIGGATTAFSPDYDPTKLRTDVAGKLVKKLVADGANVQKGQAYCEIEVMKMFMPLKVTESGKISWCMNEGASISPGDLLACMALSNPENVEKITVFEGDLDIDGWGSQSLPANRDRPHLVLRNSFDLLNSGISGYVLSKENLMKAIDELYHACTDPFLPIYDIEEKLSVLKGRIHSDLFEKLTSILSTYKITCTSGLKQRFPAEQIYSRLSEFSGRISDPNEKSAFNSLTSALVQTTLPYSKCLVPDLYGAERVLSGFLDLLRYWVSVERWFCDGKDYAEALDNLRKSNTDNYAHVLSVCRAHSQLKSTAGIVTVLIDCIEEAARVGRDSVGYTQINKRLSIVSGADSLSTTIPCLSDIGSMGGNDIYSAVALKARKLILQESLPSISQRIMRCEKMVQNMISISEEMPPGSCPEMDQFIRENVPLSDIFYTLLRSCGTDTRKQLSIVELKMRQMYQTHTLHDMELDSDSRILKFSFINRSEEGVINNLPPVRSMTELTLAISRPTSLQKLGDLSSDNEGGGTKLSWHSSLRDVPHLTSRHISCKLVDKLSDLLLDDLSFESVLHTFNRQSQSSSNTNLTNMLYIIVLEETVGNSLGAHDALVIQLQNILFPFHSKLRHYGVRRVSFILNHKNEEAVDTYALPALFTFRENFNFREDSLIRNIEPSYAYHLDLSRLATNFSVRRIVTRQTSTGNIHLYKATPTQEAIDRYKSAHSNPRIFVRALSLVADFSSTSFETILLDSLNALDLAVHEVSAFSDNHLFISFIAGYDRRILDPVMVEQTVVSVLKRHGDRISTLGLTEVETKAACCLNEDSPPILIRMVASNPTGYVQVMDTYVEAAGDLDVPVFKLIGGTKSSIACSGDSSWEGMEVSSPYPLVRPFDTQRKAALSASDSLYCYDLPALFEAAVEHQWNNAAAIGGIEHVTARPLMVIHTTELVVTKKHSPSSSWSMKDYLSNELDLLPIQRKAGCNDVGMVAWLITLKTVEYPSGRQIVLIANDITYKAGSFGTREDVVFKMASDFARSRKIPRLYVAANSGARIGLAEGVKKTFKVAFKDPRNPELGFDFLYVTEEDYLNLSRKGKQVIVEPIALNNQRVYKINDIIGVEPDLGVENLKGSGLIAGETSIAYKDIFTLTIVLGRTVGIGAYLVRLGQRTIQKTTASPIILTGYQALNKLMGVNVYSTNDQLGGPNIMYSNGISHIIATSHLSAISSAIEWLSFVPSYRGNLLPITDVRGRDDLERSIGFTPKPNSSYDPRYLLSGYEDDEGQWQSGFFDKGSFVETLAGWAKTVVVGRARLGGIPMGVIATENRTSEAIKPADPADLKASESIIQQAGCVWFPNSAYKTAQAINDFRTEDLPLIIFANWRGFSGGQRDMFDEVLKYGSLIVDAFVAYEQPVFVFIPPHAEIRGGAWVVLDSSINSSVMEMYAASDSARGGVLEANGTATVKYRKPDLIATMHRIDETLISWDDVLKQSPDKSECAHLLEKIAQRERMLLPVYEQIAVRFCDLHDTPGRMKSVGVIEREVPWNESRTFFFWRLRRKLAEFDLRRKIVRASNIGKIMKSLSALEATALIKKWALETPGWTDDMWKDDKIFLGWMAEHHHDLEKKVASISHEFIVEEVFQALTGEDNDGSTRMAGIVEGLSRAMNELPYDRQQALRASLKTVLGDDRL